MTTKYFFLPFCLFFLLPMVGLWAQFTAIPDPFFEQFLIDEGFDSGSLDGQVPTVNIHTITNLNVNFNGVLTDLTGIEDMKALVILKCGGNNIEHLDLSGNLKLEELNCTNNLLKTLNVTKNFRLKELWCGDNELEQIDVTQNTELKKLACNDNALSELDVSSNSFLELLLTHRNDLQRLDLSKNTNLRILRCSANKLTELEVSHNQLLERIDCGSNLLSAIDVTQNKELIWFSFFNNEISTLDISQNEKLESLYFPNNKLSNIDFSMNSKLRIIGCGGNQLTHLDVSMLTNLVDFDASDNLLVCLNIKNGNNREIGLLGTLNNPSLTCIQVDDPAFSTSNWEMVDPDVSFEFFCNNACSTVGTEETPKELAATLFPNPSKEAIYIEFEERTGDGNWTIYNQTGQKILRQDFASTDVLSLNPTLPSGVYFLQLETNKGLSKSFKIYRN